jgi:hypothetical protein
VTAGEPDLRRYVQDLLATLRTRDPQAYRAFVARWRDLHQRGAVERLLAMDDDALRLRMERMILDNPALADLHAGAGEYLSARGAAPSPAPTPAPGAGGAAAGGATGGPTVRLRRRRRRAAPAQPHQEEDSP